MRSHPAADMFPMLNDEELQALADDIEKNGLRSPITVIDGGGEWLILDGRNRYLACEMAGVKADRVVWAGDPFDYVNSLNRERRHMTASQLAMAADDMAKLGNGINKREAAQFCAASQEDAAKLLKVSRRNVQSARKVREKGVPELVDAVVKGNVSVSAAEAIAKLPKKEQRAVVAQGTKAVKARAKQERAKAPPPSREAAEWDRQDFLGEISSQVEDWRTEWLKHVPNTLGLVLELRLIVNVMEKENAHHQSTRVG